VGSCKSVLKSDEGLGFVESLIALFVAGMACVALLAVAAAVVRESANNEMRDSMTQYAVEGLEKVRLIADENIDDIPVPDNAVKTDYFCLDSDDGCDELGTPLGAIAYEDRCSVKGPSDGKCGKLRSSRGEDDMFYREIGIKQAGCGAVKVTIFVGFLEEGRNLARESKIEGFIGGVGDCSSP